MLLKAGIMSLLLLLISKPSYAQIEAVKTKTEIMQPYGGSNSVLPSELLIKGVVTFAEDSTVLPGVSVVQKGTNNGTQTDGDGRFELHINPSKGDILVLSFISLETQEYKIPEDTQNVVIVMKQDLSTLGEVVVIAGGLSIHGRELVIGQINYQQESGLKRFWRKITGWF